MKDGRFALGAAVLAIACCFGLSRLAGVGTATILGVVGVAFPIAVLFGIGGWLAWYLARRARAPRGPA